MTVIISGDNGVSDVDGSAGTPAIRGTDANTGIFFGSDIIGFSEGGAECARFNADAQFVAAAGTASLPVITTTGDVNTGIFFPAADTIAFAEGGAEAMRIDSAGRLVVGATSASVGGKVEIASVSNGDAITIRGRSSDALGNITFNANSATTEYARISSSDASVLTFGTGSGGAERARITSGGNLLVNSTGVLASAATAKLQSRTTATNEYAIAGAGENASYASAVLLGGCLRTANSAYDLLDLFSGNGSNDNFVDQEFRFRGDGNGYADGTFNNNGADYAEYFESANGQPLTLGATVVLDGNKVREATDQDPATSIIGVVRPKEPSKASMVVGNTAWNKWANKYLTDDFDRFTMEDHDVVEWEETITDEEGNTSTKQHSYESQAIPVGITVPADATRKTHDDKGNKFQHYKLNPAWNPDSEYVNRENRPEWNIIGLLGQVKILKGQPVGDRWIKMRDVSETVEEWMIR